MADTPALGVFGTVVAVAVLHYARDRRMLDRMVLRAGENLTPVDGSPCPVTIPTAPPTVLPGPLLEPRGHGGLAARRGVRPGAL
ncbi:hypothetical protein KGD83_15485 [Nocardiopsis akebiae]|uniref:Uncharacterized protein n=1 Tax=Nocardiopsis akebiae TaxID=2831968 RepID=A0ABX8C014_9ACTN|nr:hypothetical protein [Nocardiopsis akebiae]QUX26789.1 hypothetical protein KGD83_15485 [Nocardiopsis akebiae]